MWWQDLLWGIWNGWTAWIVLIVHAFGGWREYPLYNLARDGNWYAFGFLLGASSPLLGIFRGGRRKTVVVEKHLDRHDARREPEHREDAA